MVDNVLHLVQFKILVEKDRFTQLADGTILAIGENVNIGKECSLTERVCQYGNQPYLRHCLARGEMCPYERVSDVKLIKDTTYLIDTDKN